MAILVAIYHYKVLTTDKQRLVSKAKRSHIPVAKL